MKIIAVIGAGTMGNGIAHTFAQSEIHTNWDVTLATPAFCKARQQVSPTLHKNGYPPNNFKFF